MAVVIRLRKQGKRNRQSFRLVVTDKRERRDGKYIEQVGFYDPHVDGDNFRLDENKISYWLEKGAILSDKAKVLVRKKAPSLIPAKKKKKVKKGEKA